MPLMGTLLQTIPWKEINDVVQTMKDYERILREVLDDPPTLGRRIVAVFVTAFLQFRFAANSLWYIFDHINEHK